MARVAALVAAAGLSTRMGVPKALLRLGGEPLVLRMARLLVRAGADPCVVTIPEEPVGSQVRSALATLDVRVAFNARPAEGLIGSIRTALEICGEHISALVVSPVDCPFVESEALDRLFEVARDPAAIAAISVGGKLGHPVAFGSDLFGILRSAAADRGAASIVRKRFAQVIQVPCEDERALIDINTPCLAKRLGIDGV